MYNIFLKLLPTKIRFELINQNIIVNFTAKFYCDNTDMELF